MADWADTAPDTATAYATVLTNLRDRDKDAAKMFVVAPTNPEENFIRYNRSGDKFQEYLSAVWTDKILALAGGGTGSATAAGARTNLGIGTMGVQNSNAVAITGGSATGLASLGVTGAVDFDGGIQAGSGNVNIIDATGKIPALSSTYLANLSAANLTAIPAAQLSGTVPTANLGSGAASASTFLRGDQTWATPVGTVPSGLIAIFDAACPAGWTRVSAFDSKFVRGASSYGSTGGADTHSHTIDAVGNHDHTFGTSSDGLHGHTGTTSAPSSTQSAQVGVDGPFAHRDHTHTFSSDLNGTHSHSGTVNGAGGHSHTENAVSNVPAYINVVFCKKD